MLKRPAVLLNAGAIRVTAFIDRGTTWRIDATSSLRCPDRQLNRAWADSTQAQARRRIAQAHRPQTGTPSPWHPVDAVRHVQTLTVDALAAATSGTAAASSTSSASSSGPPPATLYRDMPPVLDCAGHHLNGEPVAVAMDERCCLPQVETRQMVAKLRGVHAALKPASQRSCSIGSTDLEPAGHRITADHPDIPIGFAICTALAHVNRHRRYRAGNLQSVDIKMPNGCAARSD